jgi:hypothetical protein
MCSSNGRAVSIAVKRVLPQRSRSCATAHHHITAILITIDLSLFIVVSSLKLHSAARQPFQPYAPSSTNPFTTRPTAVPTPFVYSDGQVSSTGAPAAAADLNALFMQTAQVRHAAMAAPVTSISGSGSGVAPFSFAFAPPAAAVAPVAAAAASNSGFTPFRLPPANAVNGNARRPMSSRLGPRA